MGVQRPEASSRGTPRDDLGLGSGQHLRGCPAPGGKRVGSELGRQRIGWFGRRIEEPDEAPAAREAEGPRAAAHDRPARREGTCLNESRGAIISKSTRIRRGGQNLAEGIGER
jgi:hypothetical protein